VALGPGPEETPHFLVGHGSQAAALGADWGAEARRLTDRCWPGPLTLVLAASGDAGSIRVSMGTTRPLRRIIRQCGPLRVAELRQPGEPPLATAAEVVAQCDGDAIDLVVDGGTRSAPGPTVVECRLSPPRVLFEGALPAAYVDAALLMGTWRRKRFGR
jgi:L-threonylcarbamoyladenylate synthase